MKISNLILEEILNNNDLSLDLSKLLEIQQASTWNLAKRKSKKLGTIKLIEFYIQRGFLLEQILIEQQDIDWVREFLNHHKRKAKV